MGRKNDKRKKTRKQNRRKAHRCNPPSNWIVPDSPSWDHSSSLAWDHSSSLASSPLCGCSTLSTPCALLPSQQIPMSSQQFFPSPYNTQPMCNYCPWTSFYPNWLKFEEEVPLPKKQVSFNEKVFWVSDLKPVMSSDDDDSDVEIIEPEPQAPKEIEIITIYDDDESPWEGRLRSSIRNRRKTTVDLNLK